MNDPCTPVYIHAVLFNLYITTVGLINSCFLKLSNKGLNRIILSERNEMFAIDGNCQINVSTVYKRKTSHIVFVELKNTQNTKKRK